MWIPVIQQPSSAFESGSHADSSEHLFACKNTHSYANNNNSASWNFHPARRCYIPPPISYGGDKVEFNT